ncbi:MAG TPA: hypothetical protein PLZ55_06700 [bacterium]|nr:hypothetical protein [bacterium]HPO08340.1 hypothetical protein [bacterium]HQO35741.1 hypothetical protein [bacterium]HQQ00959.1 hypothetical protein [bacterium]
MERIPYAGSGVLDDGKLRTPIICILAINEQQSPLQVRFIIANFAQGDTILRCEVSVELGSLADSSRIPLGKSQRFSWPLHGLTLETVNGIDVDEIIREEGYSPDDLLFSDSPKSAVWLTVRAEVFAPYASLPVWPDVASEDFHLEGELNSLPLGEFVPKHPFFFQFDPTQHTWRHVSHPRFAEPPEED